MYCDVVMWFDVMVVVCLVEVFMFLFVLFIMLLVMNVGFVDDADVSIREIEACLARRLDEEFGFEWCDGLSVK